MVRLPPRSTLLPAGCALAVLAVLAAVLGVLPPGPAGAQSELDAARAALDAAEERVAEVRARADEAAAAYGDAETRLAETEQRLERLEAAVIEAETEIEAMRDDLRDAAVARYVGASEAPTLLSGTDSLSEAVRAEALAGFAAGQDLDVLDRFRLVSAELTAAREEAEEQREARAAELEALAVAGERISAELTELERVQAEAADVLARLEEEERRRIAEEEARRRAEEEARLAAERRAAAEEARRRAAAVVATTSTRPPAEARTGAGGPGTAEPEAPATTPEVETPPEPIATGDWVCPVQGPVSFTDSWGAPRSGGRRHKGVDMMSPTGTPVVAPVAGTVTHRGNSIGGLSFHLDGDDGNYYYGTHLSAYGNDGRVEAGTIVGYVGATGNATTPHLHFEIHPGGRGNAVNPYPTVRAAC